MLTTQRCAILSQRTTGSLRLPVLQVPPKPENRLLMFVGALICAPVVLSYTAYIRLTVSTTWVAPTAELVSGGAKPLLAIPSKLRRLVVPTEGRMWVCATGSGRVFPAAPKMRVGERSAA